MIVTEIDKFINANSITTPKNSIRVDFKDDSFLVGFFDNPLGEGDEHELKKINVWRFVKLSKSVAYRKSGYAAEHMTLIEGDEVVKLSIVDATKL